MQDPYETLGVAADATPEQIRTAYRKAASSAHPDRHGGDTERMQAVNAAYELLRDPESRAAYDRGEHESCADAIPREFLREVFKRAITSNTPDVMEFALRELAGAERGARQELADVRSAIRRVEGQRNRIKATTERDVYHALLQGTLEQLQNKLEQFDQTLVAVARAREILKAEYSRGTECPERDKPGPIASLFINTTLGRDDSADAFRFAAQSS